MENKIKEAFDNVEMSAACQNKITDSFQRRPKRPWARYLTAVSAGLLLLVVLLNNPHVVQALEKAIETIKNRSLTLLRVETQDGEYYITVDQFALSETIPIIPDATTNQATDSEKETIAVNHNLSAKDYLSGTVPVWLYPSIDGLYFIADGQRIDISGVITEETPFTYVFTTSDNLIFHIIVGGTYSNEDCSLDDVGWAFWFQDGEKAKTEPGLAWIGGNSAGAYKDGEGRAWYQEGKKILNIPFP